MKVKIFKGINKTLGNKGLTIVGTLVASAIGLIVVAGTTHLLIQLTSRISQQEGRAKRPLFYSWLAGVLENQVACANTLEGYNLTTHADYDVGKIKDAAGTVLIDFYTTAGKKRLEDEFGIDNFDKLQFVYDPGTTGKEDPKLILYAKSLLHGTIPIYNKDFTLNLRGVTADPVTPSKIGSCSVVSSGLSAILENIKLEDSSQITLVGGGTTTDIPVAETTAYGYNVGSSSLSGGRNTFLGFETGQATITGSSNTFVGYQSGKANTTGGWNVFAGQKAGTANTTGRANVFIGNRVGESNDTGENNVFIGQRAGFSNDVGNRNVFVGSKAGEDNITTTGNTFIGKDAGKDHTTGANNIFIGHGAAATDLSDTDKFIVGNSSNARWIEGDINTDDLRINGRLVCLDNGTNCPTLPSSRVYKKNIKVFKDFEKSLQDILNTPLFTYQYKKNHPEKSRMGVISEELPDSLQINVEGAPSHPDWPSIYGTLWAGIKALTQRLSDFKIEILKKMTEESRLISQDFTRFKEDISSSLHVFEVFSLVLKDFKTQWLTVTNQFKEFKNQLSHFKSQFWGVEGRLKEAEGLKANVDLLNRTLAADKKVFEEGQKQLQETEKKILGNEKQILEIQKELDTSEKSLQEVQKQLTETEKQILESNSFREKQFESYDKKMKVLEEKINK